ncbi:MAG: IMP cyclohydrolase [Candidatus Falkowbacteria bacterium]
MNFKDRAERNFLTLAINRYPGRGLVLGMDETGKYLIQAYWIMGRSENSRNRIFVCEDGRELKTKAADPDKVEDPSLIIYTAMNDDSCNFVVSNGHQTNPVLSYCDSFFGVGSLIEDNDWEYKYEPDAPNYTPRITGAITIDAEKPFAEILILKKSPFSMACEKQLFRYNDFHPGIGHCVTTYAGDGDPLPSFEGEPYLLPLNGSITNIAKELWATLDEENKVSLAVKFINIENGETSVEIINKYEAVG